MEVSDGSLESAFQTLSKKATLIFEHGPFKDPQP